MGTLYAWAVFAAVYLVLASFTGVGQWQRSRVASHVLLAGALWPLAWAVWYRRDRERAAST